MMAVWFAANWLIAAVMSALRAGPTWGIVLVVVVAAAVCVMVVTVSSLVSSLPSHTLYMFWVAYPFCPDVLRSAIDVSCCPYASLKKVLRVGYILVANASHESNSWKRKMLAWKGMQMAFSMIWSSEYGSFPMHWMF
jgi:hypothetical protein